MNVGESIIFPHTHMCKSKTHFGGRKNSLSDCIYYILFISLKKKYIYIDSDLVYILFVFIHAI